MQLRSKARRLYAEHGLDLIIVDYLQLMTTDARVENRNQEISQISRALKNLARELNVPILVASQLSRAVEQRADKRPMLSDLRDSGAIEQDGDVIMFIYRDSQYNEACDNPNATELIVAKHRKGPTGTVELYWKRELTQFCSAVRREVVLA
jgi:replicative DNA helicase